MDTSVFADDSDDAKIEKAKAILPPKEKGDKTERPLS